VPPKVAVAAPTLPQIESYDFNRGTIGGHSTSYFCPKCKQRLVSLLNEAGGADRCPDCRFEYIVPGVKELTEVASNQESDAVRRAAAQQQRTEATKQAVVNKVAQQNRKNANLQLDRDPTKEWFLYFLVMTGLVALAAGKYMVAAVMHDSSHLCIVIFCLFLLGLVINFRGILRLRSEYVCAAVCMLSLRDSGLAKVTTGPAAGILQQHIIDLAEIASCDDHFTQDSLITLLYSRMMSHAKIVEILSGVLVTLGLIGTIVGLISMTNGLSDTLSSLGDDGKATELLTGMRSTMTGLGTAFNTTLVGAILGSVVLRILNNVYASNVDRLVTYVASTAEINIVPQLKRQARDQRLAS
jgi:DNA-directed RNA polymerase subunit RPC12/RpoP